MGRRKKNSETEWEKAINDSCKEWEEVVNSMHPEIEHFVSDMSDEKDVCSNGVAKNDASNSDESI